MKAVLRAAALLLGLSPFAALPCAAQTQPPSAMSIAVPPTATLGQTILLQARLVDSRAQPIAKAPVDFTVQQTFLNVSGDVVVAKGITDDTGLAKAEWQVRTSGDLAVKAVYRGDASHGTATVSGPLAVGGSQQLYSSTAGVRVPLLNWPPLAALSRLWPQASCWPILLALAIVWSLYGRVAALLLHVARAGTAEVDR